MDLFKVIIRNVINVTRTRTPAVLSPYALESNSRLKRLVDILQSQIALVVITIAH